MNQESIESRSSTLPTFDYMGASAKMSTDPVNPKSAGEFGRLIHQYEEKNEKGFDGSYHEEKVDKPTETEAVTDRSMESVSEITPEQKSECVEYVQAVAHEQKSTGDDPKTGEHIEKIDATGGQEENLGKAKVSSTHTFIGQSRLQQTAKENVQAGEHDAKLKSTLSLQMKDTKVAGKTVAEDKQGNASQETGKKEPVDVKAVKQAVDVKAVKQAVDVKAVKQAVDVKAVKQAVDVKAVKQAVSSKDEEVLISDKLKAHSKSVKIVGTGHSNSTKTGEDPSGLENAKKGISLKALGNVLSNADEKPTLGNKLPKGQPVNSAKSARRSLMTTDNGQAQDVKNTLKSAQIAEEGLLRTLDREIGIKGALHSVDKNISMLIKEKETEDKGPEKGFLRNGVEPALGNRPQAVVGRSDMGGSFNQSHSGSHENGSRGQESFRQWIVDNGDARSTGQAVQQSQFVDKASTSQLSLHALNQIMSHIEKLRESDKNRVKVSLSSGDRGAISVDIRIEDGSITTSFEGDESIINELKRDWRDIRERASRKGIILNEPEFISSSSSTVGENPFPDVDIQKKEKSQSVIQHDNNQPVRPVLQTAASGSSSPVHSYA